MSALNVSDSHLSDDYLSLNLDELENREHELKYSSISCSPLYEKLIHIALHDIESNIIKDDDYLYFGAGRTFGKAVFTRDISLSGILVLNKLYPEIMMESLKYTRTARMHTGFDVDSEAYILKAIKAPWKFVGENPYHCGPITRRSDDVIWMWGYWDLIQKNDYYHEVDYLYETGTWFFENIYKYFFDEGDGLYRGQAVFVDVHFPEMKSNGYPLNWSIEDCVMIKALSTNAIYVKALEIMSDAAKHLNKLNESKEWQDKAEALKTSINKYLKLENGTLAYYKDGNDKLVNMNDALGIAFAVMFDVYDGDNSYLVDQYPYHESGIPLFNPFFEHETMYEKIPVIHDGIYHNLTTWGFVDAFYMEAYQKAKGLDLREKALAMLARNCRESSFHELVSYKSRLPIGSRNQLWTAAGFMSYIDKLNYMEV